MLGEDVVDASSVGEIPRVDVVVPAKMSLIVADGAVEVITATVEVASESGKIELDAVAVGKSLDLERGTEAYWAAEAMVVKLLLVAEVSEANEEEPAVDKVVLEVAFAYPMKRAPAIALLYDAALILDLR